METAFAQITIAEQNGPNLSKIKTLKEKIVLAQQAAKEAEMRKALEKSAPTALPQHKNYSKKPNKKELPTVSKKQKRKQKQKPYVWHSKKRRATALTELKNNA